MHLAYPPTLPACCNPQWWRRQRCLRRGPHTQLRRGLLSRMELQEVELFVDAESPLDDQPGKIVTALPFAGEPGEVAADAKRIQPSRPQRQSDVIDETPVPPVHTGPVPASELNPSSLPAPTAARPGGHASDHTAEADLMQMDATHRTSDRAPLLGEVLRWVATSPQAVTADGPPAPDRELPPLSRLADPEDRPVPAALPPAAVQAFRHPSRRRNAFRASPELGGWRGGELPNEEVVRIAIGEIRVRIEAPRESLRESPREAATDTPRASPPEMGASTHLASVADTSHAYGASGSLRRRCIHL